MIVHLSHRRGKNPHHLLLLIATVDCAMVIAMRIAMKEGLYIIVIKKTVAWWKLLLNKSEGKFGEFYLAGFHLNKCNFKIWETKNHTIKFQKHKLFCQVISGTVNLTVFCKCWHDMYILKWFCSAGSRLIQTLFSPTNCHLREMVLNLPEHEIKMWLMSSYLMYV